MIGVVSRPGSRWLRKTAVTTTVPTALEHTGNYSQAAIVYDPNSNSNAAQRTAFPNNTIPSSRINAIGATIMGLFPLPNIAGTANNFTGLQSTYTLVDNIVGRADQLFGDRQRFSFKVAHVESESAVVGPLGAIDSPNQDLFLPSRSYSASYTLTLSSSMVYSAAAGYTLFQIGRASCRERV